VATPFAFRGFEHFKHSRNVRLADNPVDFQDLLVQALRSERYDPGPTDVAQLDRLVWTATLQDLPEQFAALPRRERDASANLPMLRSADRGEGFLSALSQRLGLWRRS